MSWHLERAQMHRRLDCLSILDHGEKPMGDGAVRRGFTSHVPFLAGRWEYHAFVVEKRDVQ